MFDLEVIILFFCYMPKLLMTIALFSFLVLIGCTATTKEQEDKLPEALIDRIVLVDLEGNKVNLDDYKGKTIFLNYWATWCRPCIAEMPDIDEAAQILGDEEFIFLAASDEALDKIKNYVAETDYSFKFVKSETSVFDLDIMALPTTMIISRNGEIVYNEVGARKWNSETEIEKLRKIAQ